MLRVAPRKRSGWESFSWAEKHYNPHTQRRFCVPTVAATSARHCPILFLEMCLLLFRWEFTAFFQKLVKLNQGKCSISWSSAWLLLTIHRSITWILKTVSSATLALFIWCFLFASVHLYNKLCAEGSSLWKFGKIFLCLKPYRHLLPIGSPRADILHACASRRLILVRFCKMSKSCSWELELGVPPGGGKQCWCYTYMYSLFLL